MGERTWPLLLATLLDGTPLSTEDTAWAMGEIMGGSATDVQIAAFAIALRAKGETPEEIGGLVEAMLANAVRVELSDELRGAAVDVVGTGGDRAHTVNISTMAAIVVAGCDVPVIKHGNRAATSSCGAADLLETLGIPLELGPEEVASCVRDVGIGFCFAPRFHSGLRYAALPRREIGVPTAFNFLGPLTNPAQPTAAAVGCADARMAPVMAAVFARRGDSVLVMRGEDGLDEFTTTAPTRLWVVADGRVDETLVDALDLGIARSHSEELRGADAVYNAEVARGVFAGEAGPVRDAVVLNAAAALAARAGVADDLHAALRAGVEKAGAAIDSGSAADVLDRWVRTAQSVRTTA
jgi:anthranilate phosphoribosyltransferase